jgi:hypothetical protein
MFDNAAALALSPTADCIPAGDIPGPLNESAVNCCQTVFIDSDDEERTLRYGFAFELRSANGSYSLARATVERQTVVLTPLDSGGEEAFVGFR